MVQNGAGPGPGSRAAGKGGVANKDAKASVPKSTRMKRLTRDTPFICNFTFKNDLPPVPAEPRLLVDPPEPQKLSKFFVTQMERDKHHDLYVDPDRIIPLPLMAPEMYAVRPGAALDPADKALVAAAIEGSQKAEIGETAWLVRTRYLTAVSGPVAKPAPKHHEAAEVTLTEEDVLQHVEGTFAESELRHPRDPTLRPVSVLPLLPDLSGRDLLAVQFDGHPTRDVRGVRGLTAAQKEYLARTAILKNLRVIVEGVKAPLSVMLVKEEVPPPNQVPAQEKGDAVSGKRRCQQEYRKDPVDLMDPWITFEMRGDHVAFAKVPRSAKMRRLDPGMRQEMAGSLPTGATVRRGPANEDAVLKAEAAREETFGPIPEGVFPTVMHALTGVEDVPFSEDEGDGDGEGGRGGEEGAGVGSATQRESQLNEVDPDVLREVFGSSDDDEGPGDGGKEVGEGEKNEEGPGGGVDEAGEGEREDGGGERGAEGAGGGEGRDEEGGAGEGEAHAGAEVGEGGEGGGGEGKDMGGGPREGGDMEGAGAEEGDVEMG